MFSFRFYHKYTKEECEVVAESYEEAVYQLKPATHWILIKPEDDQELFKDLEEYV